VSIVRNTLSGSKIVQKLLGTTSISTGLIEEKKISVPDRARAHLEETANMFKRAEVRRRVNSKLL